MKAIYQEALTQAANCPLHRAVLLHEFSKVIQRFVCALDFRTTVASSISDIARGRRNGVGYAGHYVLCSRLTEAPTYLKSLNTLVSRKREK